MAHVARHVRPASPRASRRNFTFVVPTPWLNDDRLTRYLWERYIYCQPDPTARGGSRRGCKAAAAAARARHEAPPSPRATASPHGVMPHLNSKRRLIPRGAALDPGVWALLRERNAWDVALYAHVLAEQAHRPPWDE